MIEILSFGFMQNAVIAGILASVACGVIGSLVVVNRIVFISGGIAHTAYGGIGLAFFLGFSPLLGAGIFAVGAAVLMALITKNTKHRADTVIGAMWAFGMAVGIILLDLTPGYNVDLMSYLFGKDTHCARFRPALYDNTRSGYSFLYCHMVQADTCSQLRQRICIQHGSKV